MAGNNAIKKEKAMADALVVMAPFTMLCQKKIVTSYMGIPSKNGNETLRAFSTICSVIFLYVFRFRSPFVIGSFLIFNSKLVNVIFAITLFQKKINPEGSVTRSQVAYNILGSFFPSLMNH